MAKYVQYYAVYNVLRKKYRAIDIDGNFAEVFIEYSNGFQTAQTPRVVEYDSEQEIQKWIAENTWVNCDK